MSSMTNDERERAVQRLVEQEREAERRERLGIWRKYEAQSGQPSAPNRYGPSATPARPVVPSGAVLPAAELVQRYGHGQRCFDGATIVGSLHGARLQGGSFTGADFRQATLTQANLSHCNLRGANLTGVEAWGVNLEAADLTGARTDGLDLRQAVLAGVRGLAR